MKAELAVEVSGVLEVKSGFFCLQQSVQLVVRADLDLLTLEVLYFTACPQQGVQFCAENQHLTAVFSTLVESWYNFHQLFE